jgi:hypothetical protein
MTPRITEIGPVDTGRVLRLPRGRRTALLSFE